MTIRIDLAPQLEQWLREQAAAAGVDPTRYVLLLLEQHATPAMNQDERQAVPSQSWKTEFDSWLAGVEQVDSFIDDSRDSIYAGRGE